jgi:hypothetical protein
VTTSNRTRLACLTGVPMNGSISGLSVNTSSIGETTPFACSNDEEPGKAQPNAENRQLALARTVYFYSEISEATPRS